MCPESKSLYSWFKGSKNFRYKVHEIVFLQDSGEKETKGSKHYGPKYQVKPVTATGFCIDYEWIFSPPPIPRERGGLKVMMEREAEDSGLPAGCESLETGFFYPFYRSDILLRAINIYFL